MKRFHGETLSVCILAAGVAACSGSTGDPLPVGAARGPQPDEAAPISSEDDGAGAEGEDPAPGGALNDDTSATEEELRPKEDDSPLSTLPFDPTGGDRANGRPLPLQNVTCPSFEGFTWHDETPTAGADLGNAVAASCDAVYQVGSTTGAISGEVNRGGSDAFVRKVGQDGNLVWGAQIGTSASDQATGVAVSSAQCPASGNASLYVVGHTSGAIEAGQHKGSSDAFLVKLNANGTEAWRRQLGTAAVDQAWSVAHAPDGSVYVVGSTGGNLAGVSPPPTSGTTSLFVAKVSPSGDPVWTRQLGVNNRTTIARSVSVGADGQVYVAGYTTGALAGQPYAGGSADAFVARYSDSGALGGVALLGTNLQDQAFSLTTAVESGQTVVYVSGTTNGNFPPVASSTTYDAFLAKLDASLTTQWIRQTTASENVSATSVAVVRGSVVLTGQTRRDLDSDAPLGSDDMYLREYSAAGAHLRTEYIGTNATEAGQGVAVDPRGNVFLTGRTDAPFCGHSFGGGGSDALLVKVMKGCRVDTPEPSCKPATCNGDPHYVSFDRVAFDFQGEGDFVLATSAATPDLEIQIRQCPVSPGVSTGRAVGARIAGDLVEFHANGALYVNGQPTTVPSSGALALAGGGSIYPSASGRTVLAWPTGERLALRPRSYSLGLYLDTLFLVPPASVGKMVGLFGNADDDPTNEFMMARDGSALSSGLTFFEMYQDTNSYADVWRVGAAQGDVALIQQGTPCGGPAGPGQPVWLNDLTPAQRAAGEQACAGITDAVIKQTCILDVGLTGDASFADSAQEAATDLASHGQGGQVIDSPRSVYFNDFTGSIGPEWASIVTSVTPLGDRTFLGQFGNETVHLTLDELAPHTELTVSFDLYLINAWDGDGPLGPSVWTASADGVELFSETFSNTLSSQSYPLDGSLAGSGALEVNTLAYPSGDSVYRMKLVFPHSAPDLALDLSATGLTGLFDEGWGVTNIEVQGR
ncbi:SBBP repeat-containing protein [Sorangium sp. So ce385]|uniref:SBBP repeat-containing protein n=1 Tax=Sorangium sp. So ce385 TaxID=3133308 RepID=UPI003F5C1285